MDKLTKRQLRLICFLLAKEADDIHEGDPADFTYSEKETLSVLDIVKQAWESA